MNSETETVLTVEQIIFVALLESILAELPQKTVDLLALGPIDDADGIRGCRLCDTMSATIDRNNSRQVMLANVLLDYHDIDGSEGSECYRRCCQIYLAAGWNGEM